jgi:hypothetical protein
MSIITKTKGLVAGILGLTLAFSLFVGVGVKTSGAQALTAAQLIDLLISLGIIAPDKAAAARSAVGGTSGSSSSTVSTNFTRDLQVGSVGADVKMLQQWLNANGYTVAMSGAGSMGMETTTFGPATRAALIKFQIAKGITPAAGYFGPRTMAAIAAMGGTPSSNNGGGTVVVPTGSEVMVSLSSDTPANVALVSGQAIGDLAHFTLKNNSSVEARITSLVLNRIGVSNDSTINNVYVYDGGRRLTDSAVVSSGKITFNEPAGMLVIPAGFSKTISIRADIAGSTAGQILGVQLVSVGANVPVLGSFPISGNPLSIASATMATVDFNSSTLPASAVTIEPQDGYTVWQNTVSISTRAVDLKSISFRQTGSIQTSDVRNFKLFVDGVQVGSTVAAIDSNNYVTFDLASPIRLQTGGRVVKLVADVVGGSTKNFIFQLRQPSDAMMIDSELMQPVLATANSTTFSARSSATVTIQGASLSVTKANSSPTDNVSVDASNVKLATFEFRASGENIKVENLDIQANTTGSNGGLDNGKVFVNGVQVGSTKDLTEATDVNFTFGSSFIVNAGTVAIVDIYADVKTTSAASYNNSDTIAITIGAGSSNAQGMTSLTTISTPSSDTTANTITVNSAAVTVSKNSGYGDQTIVAGTAGAKLGSFSISAGSTEGIDVNTITINLSADEAATITNMTLKDQATGNVLGTVKTTPSTANSFSVNLPIAKSSTKVIEVYADVKTNSNAGTWTATVEVNGNGQTTGNSASTSSAVTLQTITLGSGSLTLAVSANNPDSDNVVAGTMVKIGQFTFKAVNSGFTVNELKVKVPNGAASSTNGVTIKYKDVAGVTQTVSQALVTGTEANATATFTGLSMYVPKNNTVGSDVEVWTTINSLQSNNGQSGAAITASIDYNEGFKATPDGGSVITTVGSADVASSDNTGEGTMYGRVSVPKFAKQSLSTSLLSNGEQDLYKFTVSADAKGPVEIRKLTFTVATTGVTITGFYLRDVSKSTDVNASTAAEVGASNKVVIYPGGILASNSVEQIAAGGSITYVLRGTVAGVASSETDSVTITFTEDSSAVANQSSAALTSSNLVWSDVSATSHTTVTADWTNGYLLKDFTTDSQTLSDNN